MTKKGTTILGIDPGSRITGYGIIEKEDSRLRCISCGTIRTDKNTSFSDRLLQIHLGLAEVIDKYLPATCAIENIFLSRNVQSALKLGQARGVAILTAMKADMLVYDYTPRMVKQAVAGYGQADKVQVQNMVRILLQLTATPSADAADALAVAICHAHRIDSLNLPLPAGRREALG